MPRSDIVRNLLIVKVLLILAVVAHADPKAKAPKPVRIDIAVTKKGF